MKNDVYHGTLRPVFNTNPQKFWSLINALSNAAEAAQDICTLFGDNAVTERRATKVVKKNSFMGTNHWTMHHTKNEVLSPLKTS